MMGEFEWDNPNKWLWTGVFWLVCVVMIWKAMFVGGEEYTGYKILMSVLMLPITFVIVNFMGS